MTYFRVQKCVQVSMAMLFGLLCILFYRPGFCHPASVRGSTVITNVTNFPFFARLVNPCEVIPSFKEPLQNLVETTQDTPAMKPNIPSIDFYHAMELALKKTWSTLEELKIAAPNLPECNGISLDSLPSIPSLGNMSDGETTNQAYKSIIFLTAHFHLMTLDRQVNNQKNEHVHLQRSEVQESNLGWRFQHCGNETEKFPSILLDVTNSMENVLCTILSSASEQQLQSFRAPLMSLQRTVLYRYRASCSTLQTRDCLVVREAYHTQMLLSRKYGQLIEKASRAPAVTSDIHINSVTNDEDYMENHI